MCFLYKVTFLYILYILYRPYSVPIKALEKIFSSSSIHVSITQVTNLTTHKEALGAFFTFFEDNTRSKFKVIVTSSVVVSDNSVIIKLRIPSEPVLTEIQIDSIHTAFYWSDEATGLTVVEFSDAGIEELIRRGVSFLNISDEVVTPGDTLAHIEYQIANNQFCFSATKVEAIGETHLFVRLDSSEGKCASPLLNLRGEAAAVVSDIENESSTAAVAFKFKIHRMTTCNALMLGFFQARQNHLLRHW